MCSFESASGFNSAADYWQIRRGYLGNWPPTNPRKASSGTNREGMPIHK
jgi:hypothetical protein